MNSRTRVADRAFLGVTAFCALVPVLLLVLIAVIVVVQSMPSIRFMGWHFIYGKEWNMGNLYGSMVKKNGVTAPSGASYGALPFIIGTLGSSVIALLIAVPISIFTALILAYQVRRRLSVILSVLVELLAGIPSVVFGLWGILVLAPWIGHRFGPWLSHLGVIFPFFKGPIGTGMGLLTSGIVLAIMIIPIITATTRDLLRQVPILAREAGIGLGMTTWETIRYICLPSVRDGLVGAVALGWGRAMGETMAVLMVSGSALNYLPQNIYSPISTMAAVIADQLDSALTDATKMAVHALAELALVLMVLTLLTNLIARWLVNRGSAGKGLKAGTGA